MTHMQRWTVGFVFCLLLVASRASAAYVVVENISQDAPDWGDCSCHDATGWLGFITMGVTLIDSDGTPYVLILQSADYSRRGALTKAGNYYLLDITKKNVVPPGGSYTSKKIPALPDSGFTFKSAGADIGVYYCEAALDSCGGYSTSGTDVNEMFIVPGVSGSDSFEFQVPAAGSISGPAVVRVTFYPGNPPPPGKNR